MKEKFKVFLETKGINQEAYEAKTAKEVADLHMEFSELQQKSIDEAIAAKASKEEIQSLVKEMNDSNKEATKTMFKAIEEIGTRMKAMTESEKKENVPAFKKEFDENKEAIKALATKMGGKDVVMKAVTNRASVTNNEYSFDLPDIGQLAHAQLSAANIFPSINISDRNDNGVIRYTDWDESTKVRAAAMVAEGAAFPESTAKWIQYTLDIRKIGDTIPVTEEMLEDAQMFEAELSLFLLTNIEILENDQIVNGDNVGENLKGILTSIPAYTAVASGISDASVYDLLVKVREDIVTAGGSKYRPDFAMMKLSLINQMKLKKDANDNYILPPFVDRNGEVVDGMVVIAEESVPADQLIVGDRRYGRIYRKSGVALSTGHVDAQFSSDLMTLKARKRLAFLIRQADAGGFRKVTDVSAALTTLATVPV